jgi:mono/diheme cytochrome c family protein/plastocyanin
MRLVATGSASRLSRPAGLVLGAVLVVAVGGCEVKRGQPDLVEGKQLFVSKCGSCHVLARADTKGQVGPNLDQAFQAALGAGFGRSSVRGIVEKQILYPLRGGQMPAKLVHGRDAQNVAAYVAAVVARPGKDTGALATAVGGGQKPLAVERGGKLEIPADPNGQLLYTFKNAQGKPGPVTITSPNKSSVPHNIAIQGPGANQLGPIGQSGHVSTIHVTLKPGAYTFYCSVDAHRQGGMVGKLTVK